MYSCIKKEILRKLATGTIYSHTGYSSLSCWSLTRSMPTRKTFMSFLDNTFVPSTQNVCCSVVKDLDIPCTKYMLAENRTEQEQTNKLKLTKKKKSKERQKKKTTPKKKAKKKASFENKKKKTYPFPIRETTPKEVRTRSANSIFNCISYNCRDQYRK